MSSDGESKAVVSGNRRRYSVKEEGKEFVDEFKTKCKYSI